MEFPNEKAFERYLSAKKTVDDRALNRAVFEALRSELAGIGSEPPRILEIGAGIGTMVERSLEWGLTRRGHYHALDAASANIDEAMTRLPAWAQSQGYGVETVAAGAFRLSGKDADLGVTLETADVLEFATKESNCGKWDLLIANAFLDLVDARTALPDLFALLKPRGLFWFTITFDGASIFQPEIDPALDARIEALYHETMDSRVINGRVSGDSRTGRHFFRHARSMGAEILAAGSSDWVVFAGPKGYPADEAFFLRFIIQTVGGALNGHPDLDQAAFAAWVKERLDQVDRGELTYIAHQMDFLGRRP